MRHLKTAAALVAVAAAGPAFAAPPVLTDLVSAIDTSTLLAAILAIGGTSVVVRLTWSAVRYMKRGAGTV